LLSTSGELRFSHMGGVHERQRDKRDAVERRSCVSSTLGAVTARGEA
jgi:hypothetical protein